MVEVLTKDNMEDWERLRVAGGSRALQSFNKVWYKHAGLTPEELQLLRDLFNKYPLGKDNFKTWLKQTTRQLFEKNIITNISSQSRLNVLT